MGITKLDDVIGWETVGKLLCVDCGGDCEDKPLIEADFSEDDIVTCDGCEERIQ